MFTNERFWKTREKCDLVRGTVNEIFSLRTRTKRATLFILSGVFLIACMALYRFSTANEDGIGSTCEVSSKGNCCRNYYRSIAKDDSSNVKVVGQIDYAVDNEVFSSIKDAIKQTVSKNQNFTYVIVSESLEVLSSLQSFSFGTSFDLWHCCSINYGTTFLIGSLYRGPKVASSIDNIFPRWKFNCSFQEGNRDVVYALSRSEIDSSGNVIKGCDEYRSIGSFDGFVFQNINRSALDLMIFPRFYWGSENVAAFAMKRYGAILRSMCPFYFPSHVNHPRKERIRINHYQNSVMRVRNASSECFG